MASLAPDPADLPVHQIIETVQPAVSLTEQAQALEVHSFNLFRSDVTRSSDSADTLLQRLGLDDPEAAAFLRSNNLVRQNLLGRAGRQVNRIDPLAVGLEHAQRAVMKIQVPEAVDVFVFVAAHRGQ